MKKISKKKINSSSVEFSIDIFTHEINKGSHSFEFNESTEEKIINGLGLFFQKNNIKNVFIGITNKTKNSEKFISNIKNLNLNLFTTQNNLMSSIEISNILKENNIHGILFSDSEKKIIINLYDNFGLPFDFNQYSEINMLLNDKYVDSLSKENEIKIIQKNDLYDLSKFSEIDFSNFSFFSSSNALDVFFESWKDIDFFSFDSIKKEKTFRKTNFSKIFKIVKRKKINNFIIFNENGTRFELFMKLSNKWKKIENIEFQKFIMNKFNLNGKNILDKNEINLEDDLNYYYSGTDSYIGKYNNNNSFEFLLYLFTNNYFQLTFDRRFSSIKNDAVILNSKEIKLSNSDLENNKLINSMNCISKEKNENSEISTYKSKNNFVKIMQSSWNNQAKINVYTLGKNEAIAHSENQEFSKNIVNSLLNKEDVNNLKSKRGQIRLWLFISIFIIGFAVMFMFIFNPETINEVFLLIGRSAHRPEIYIQIFYIFLLPIVFGLGLKFIMKKFDNNAKLKDMILAMIIFIFVNSIVPVVVISLGVLYWFLKTKKYDSNVIVGSVSIILLSFVSVNILTSLPMIIYGHYYLASIGMINWAATGMAIGGLFWYSFWFFIIFLIAYSTHLQNIIFRFLGFILLTFGFEKTYNNFYKNFNFSIKKTKENNKLVKKNFKTILIIFGIFTFFKFYLWLTFYSSISIIYYDKLNGELNSFWQITSVNVIVTCSVLFFPIPGGALGVTEYLLVNSLSEIIQQKNPGYPNVEEVSLAIAEGGTFIFRFFTFYAPLCISFIISFWIIFKNSFIKKSKNLNQISI